MKFFFFLLLAFSVISCSEDSLVSTDAAIIVQEQNNTLNNRSSDDEVLAAIVDYLNEYEDSGMANNLATIISTNGMPTTDDEMIHFASEVENMMSEGLADAVLAIQEFNPSIDQIQEAVAIFEGNGGDVISMHNGANCAASHAMEWVGLATLTPGYFVVSMIGQSIWC